MASDYREFAKDVLDNPLDPNVLAKLRQASAGQVGREILFQILEIERAKVGQPDSIEKTMSLFELIEDADPVVAGYFMALLYPVASDAFLHDVCDGIAMSIAMKRSAELAPILRDLASNEADDDIAKRYREWAGNIEAS